MFTFISVVLLIVALVFLVIHCFNCMLWKLFNSLFGWHYGVANGDICRVKFIEHGYAASFMSGYGTSITGIWGEDGEGVNVNTPLHPLTFKFERVNND